jgi:hypothetical protein
VLSNETWQDWAVEHYFKFPVSPIYIWYHTVEYDTGAVVDDGAKEDMTAGTPILAGLYLYAYSNNETLKDRVYNMTQACADAFWYPSAGDAGRFIYRVNATSGEVYNTYSVHGFGLLDEAMIQGYLLWNNATWLDRATKDWLDLAYHDASLSQYNDLIAHSVDVNDVVQSADSNDAWNSAAKRAGQLLYNLNVAGYYHNMTYWEGYEKLYGSTSNNHKWLSDGKGWVQVVDATDRNFWAGSLADNTMVSLQTIFRNFQAKNVTIDSFADLYSEFGNPFTGEEDSIAQPTFLTVEWNEINPWSEDVGHTLAEVNASVWADGVELYGLVYINATQHYEFYFEYEYYAAAVIVSTDDTLRLWCNTGGSWYHNYS